MDARARRDEEQVQASNQAGRKVSRRGFMKVATAMSGSAAFFGNVPSENVRAGGSASHQKQSIASPASHTYAAPGQVCVVAQHGKGFHARAIAGLMRKHRLMADRQFAAATIVPERIVTIENNAHAMSLVFATVPTVASQDETLELTSHLSQYADGPSERAKEAPDFAVLAATPNWFAGGAPVADGLGSPGAPPVPPDPDPPLPPVDPERPFWQFNLPDDLGVEAPYAERGAGVDVFILDTAPDRVDLDHAYHRWKDSHPLIANLLAPEGLLNIVYAGDMHLLNKIDYYLPNADYIMADHGLFVAGIIHAIAPAARLHLVEVLNPYGVGSLESIARGFALAGRSAASGASVVINASLCLDVPYAHPEWLQTVSQQDPFWSSFSVAQVEATVAPLAYLCDLLEQQHATIVAAAGNDAKYSSGTRPPASYPAAFPSVVGVGALLHDSITPASYSNICDTPIADGFATFGGDTTHDLTDAEYGILGVYTGEFPGGAPNESGRARWAGTSFATPVVSGTLAALTSEPGIESSEAARNRMSTIAGTMTEVGKSFPVTQG